MRIKKGLLSLSVVGILLISCTSSGSAKNTKCHQATFVDHVILDVPVDEGTLIMPGMQFTKTWRLINSGDCEWNQSYTLVLISGEQLSDQDEIPFPVNVSPSESLDISVLMQAPESPGRYKGEWEIKADDGQIFGVGANGDSPLRVEIEVAELANSVRYEFDQVHCLAQWHSALASFLPCQGLADETDILQGYVRLNTNPVLEGSSVNNFQVLEVKANNQTDNWIAGFFPGIEIADGDHFTATIGCMDLLENCAIHFYFEIVIEGGDPQRLASWTEIYDDDVTNVDVDLSEFAGTRVNFVLRMEEEGSGRSLESIGFWQHPRIVQN